MRIITTALITICAFVYSFAQTPSPSAENWQTVTPSGEEFSVEAPAEMTLSTQHPKRDLGRTYFNDLNGTYFRIFSEKRSEAYSIEKGLEFIRGFQKKGGGVTFGRIKAEKFDFEDDDKFFHRVIYLQTSSRAYLFHAISENRDDNAAKRFLGSIQIAKRPISGAGTDYDETPPPNGTGNGPGTGAGTGFRGTWPFDREGRSGTRPLTADPAAPTQNVKILTKPRAPYTDLARTYYISGTITVRITFLASGEIGEVNPLSRLPFGMTGQAIAAAKAVTFEPARKEGVAYTKMIVVQYNFSIH